MDDLSRRNFLKAAGITVAGIAGSAAIAGATGFGIQQNPNDDPSKKKDEPKDEDRRGDDAIDDLDGSDEPESDQSEETRGCPQCGALMYKQGNTWTCETCGYSFVE